MRKAFSRTGLAVLSVVALVGNSPPAGGHGTIAGGGTTVHTCIRSLSPRLLRIVTPADVCSSSEQGIDLPQVGSLVVDTGIGVELGPITAAPGAGLAAVADNLTAPMVAACPANPTPPTHVYRAIGVTFLHTTDLALAESFPTSTTTWQVSFIAATTGNKPVTVQAVCVRQFQQT